MPALGILAHTTAQRRLSLSRREQYPPFPMPERAILVAVELKSQDRLWDLDDTLTELGYLARTAGAEVVGTISQRANRYTTFYMGKGKLEELWIWPLNSGRTWPYSTMSSPPLSSAIWKQA